MSNLTPVIDHIDGLNRRIYLKQGVVDFFPIEDIYHEYRTLRRNDTDSIRQYNALLKAEGNISKGAGAFTPRYVVLLEGTKIVPFDEASQLNQLGDIITDDPDNDPDLYDISGLTTAKPIFIKPSEAETIQLNSESIVHSSFEGGVWLDINSIYSDKGSSTEPNGNQERPVNNMVLALEIAVERGFKRIYILSSTLTINEDLSGGYKLIGDSPFNLITINPAADVTEVEIENLTIQGELDGLNVVKHSGLISITDVSGLIQESSFKDDLYVNGNILIVDCISNIPGGGYATINGVTGASIQLRDFRGSIGLNGIVDGVHSIGGSEGRVVIEAGCTGGTIHLRGEWFEIIDNSGVGCTVLDERNTAEGGLNETELHDALDTYTNKDGYKATTTISSNMRGTDNANTVEPDNTTIALINTKVNEIDTKIDTMQSVIDGIDITTAEILSNVAYQERVIFIDTEAIPPGDGTSKTPFSDFTVAIDFAEAQGIKKIIIFSDITADRNLKNFVFIGVGTPALDCNGHNLDKSEFNHLVMKGTYTGNITVQESVLFDGFSLNGWFERCALGGTLTNIGHTDLINCVVHTSGGVPVIISNSGGELEVRGLIGPILLTNNDTALSTATLIMNGGKITLDTTCTDGFIGASGVAGFVDNSNGSTVDISTLLNQELADRIARGSVKIDGTELISYDELGEIQRWNLFDVNNLPSNENVFLRTKQ